MKLGLGVVMGLLLAAPVSAAPETYVIDTPHSFSNFEVGHLGVTWIRGRFNKTTGKITLDRAANNGSIEAEIDASSVDTGYPRRDELLRTEDYFNSAKFPTISFRSSNLRFKGDALVSADGELTMLGVTRPVNLEITSFKCITHPVNKREICGAVAHGTLQRSGFGMTQASRSLSDEIRIYINVEAIKN
ncbi:MAG: YceI family protein [Pseudomonadota bacterium]